MELGRSIGVHESFRFYASQRMRASNWSPFDVAEAAGGGILVCILVKLVIW
jgi:hypothetical protein